MTAPRTREELARHLDELGVNPIEYDLHGGGDNAHGMDRTPEGWVVYFSERGKRSGETVHADEADAVADLLGRVTRSDHAFRELVAGPAPAEQADAQFAAWLAERGITVEDLGPDGWMSDDIPWLQGEPGRRHFVRIAAARRFPPRTPLPPAGVRPPLPPAGVPDPAGRVARMDGLVSNLDLNGPVSPRVKPRVGEWGPVDVPTTRSKRMARWKVIAAAVIALAAVVAFGYFAYLQLRGF